MIEKYKKEISKRLIKELLDIQLLRLINTENNWGYKIKKTIETTLDIKLRHGALYPTLNQLQNDGYLISQNQKQNGRYRKTYKLTNKGRQYLKAYYAILGEQIST